MATLNFLLNWWFWYHGYVFMILKIDVIFKKQYIIWEILNILNIVFLYILTISALIFVSKYFKIHIFTYKNNLISIDIASSSISGFSITYPSLWFARLYFIKSYSSESEFISNVFIIFCSIWEFRSLSLKKPSQFQCGKITDA